MEVFFVVSCSTAFKLYAKFEIYDHAQNSCTGYCIYQCLSFPLTDIIKKYSNFVGFPIYLDGTCINTIQVC